MSIQRDNIPSENEVRNAIATLKAYCIAYSQGKYGECSSCKQCIFVKNCTYWDTCEETGEYGKCPETWVID